MAHQIKNITQDSSQFNDSQILKFQLQKMAQNPEFQAEIVVIDKEFAIAELDGL
ncbi:hypothetical protein [Laspinema palackyanum]|uniref:hypothetical protein n=1 Tax=Laspinema palackyanum TaxID=3231601 RepID=UPI00345DD88D|nr:hypothetical protein [Laspinema sp. D2c]